MLCRRLDGSSKDSNWLQCLITYTEQHFTFSLFTSEHFSLEFLYLPQNVGLLAKFFPKDWTFLSHWLFLSSLISRIWFLSSLKGYIFVKILHIFSISNAAVLPDSKSCVQKKLCAKAETFLSMCMRCITYRHFLQRQLLHFTSSSHLGHFHSLESCSPLWTPEMSAIRALSEGHVALIAPSDILHHFYWTVPCGRNPGLFHRHTNGGAEKLMVGLSSPSFT